MGPTLRRVSLRNRVTGAFGLPLVATLVLAGVLAADVRAQAQVQQGLDDLVNPAVLAGQRLASAEVSIAITLGSLAQTGAFETRRDLVAATAARDDEVTELSRIAASSPDLARQVDRIGAAVRRSQQVIIEPTIAAVDADQLRRARRIAASPAAMQTAQAISTELGSLFESLSAQRADAASQLRLLNIALWIVLVILVGCLALSWLYVLRLIRNGVIAPLEALAANLRRTAIQRSLPVTAPGDGEFASLADDAEHLRRELVAQIDEAHAARAAMMQDAPLVAALEVAMQPPTPPDAGLQIAGTTRAQEGIVNGDWWDAIERPDGTVAIVLADVAGHGIPAALTALRVRTVLHAHLASGADPAEALALAVHALPPPTPFVTVFIAIIDARANVLRWANAGHPPAVIVRADKSSTTCPPTGPMLSRHPSDWTEGTFTFAPGDALIAFTDGLLEAPDASSEPLDEETLIRWIRGEDGFVRSDARELLDRTIARFRHRAASLDDDVTVVCVTR